MIKFSAPEERRIDKHGYYKSTPQLGNRPTEIGDLQDRLNGSVTRHHNTSLG